MIAKVAVRCQNQGRKRANLVATRGPTPALRSLCREKVRISRM
jgi:hypothetical protein